MLILKNTYYLQNMYSEGWVTRNYLNYIYYFAYINNKRNIILYYNKFYIVFTIEKNI